MENPDLKDALAKIISISQKQPDAYSPAVVEKLNRYLPLAMRLPISLRRFGAKVLGIKHPLAKKYWKAHRKISRKHSV